MPTQWTNGTSLLFLQLGVQIQMAPYHRTHLTFGETMALQCQQKSKYVFGMSNGAFPLGAFILRCAICLWSVHFVMQSAAKMKGRFCRQGFYTVPSCSSQTLSPQLLMAACAGYSFTCLPWVWRGIHLFHVKEDHCIPDSLAEGKEHRTLRNVANNAKKGVCRFLRHWDLYKMFLLSPDARNKA